MTLDEAKVLLSEHNIPIELCEFHNEAEYWCHTTLFPYTKNAQSCKVIAIIIRSNNGKKNIELQFNAVGDVFRFEELWFVDYAFEMFDYNEDMLADDLLRNILEIKQGNLIIIDRNDIVKKRLLADACFDLSDEDNDFGEPGFQKALQRIKRPKGLFSKLRRVKEQYEIYGWDSYQCTVK